MKKTIQYCCFALLLILYSITANAQSINSGLLSIATNTQWTVTGDYNNNNQELAIDIGSATENNLLMASGNIILSGKLIINLANSFAPTAAQTFTIISAASVAGTFSNIVFPSGYTADIRYNSSNVVLSNFRSASLTITASAGTGGTISSNGITNVNANSSKTYSITPNSNYCINDVVVDGISQGAISTYTFNNIVVNHTIAASFAARVTPVVTIVSNATASFCFGKTVTFSAIVSNTGSNPTYQWKKNGNNVGTNASSYTDATLTSADNITCTVTRTIGCITSASSNSLNFTVNQIPTVANITGATNVCIGGSTTLSNTTTGGVWSSLNNRANINASSGILTGASSGVANIKYTVTTSSGCSNFVSYSLTVNALSNIPSIGYAPGTVNPQTGAGGAFCANRTFTVVGSPSGGLWSKTGVITIGSSSGIVNTGTIAGAGSLTYTYTDANACSNSRTITGNVVVCASRGVNEGQSIIDNSQWIIYPNPAKTFIRLNVETLIGAGTIVITDLYGKQVKTQPLSMGSNIVDIINLSKGMYFVSVVTNEGKTTKKLVVE